MRLYGNYKTVGSQVTTESAAPWYSTVVAYEPVKPNDRVGIIAVHERGDTLNNRGRSYFPAEFRVYQIISESKDWVDVMPLTSFPTRIMSRLSGRQNTA